MIADEKNWKRKVVLFFYCVVVFGAGVITKSTKFHQ